MPPISSVIGVSSPSAIATRAGVRRGRDHIPAVRILLIGGHEDGQSIEVRQDERDGEHPSRAIVSSK